jgi:hypothetical protein
MLAPWHDSSGGGGAGTSGTEEERFMSRFFRAEGEERLVVFRSQAGHDSITVIDPKTSEAKTYNTMTLMAALRADERVTGAAPLNIGAAAVIASTGSLALFNCGSAPGGRTSVVVTMLNALSDYLGAVGRAVNAADGSLGSEQDAAARVLAPRYFIVHLELPPLTAPAPGGGGGVVNYSASVSAASTIAERPKGKALHEYLLIAASYANDAGEALGTRLAVLPTYAVMMHAMNSGCTGRGPVPLLDLTALSALVTVPPAEPTGSSSSSSSSSSSAAAAPLLAKIEGAAVRRCEYGRVGTDGVVDVLAVADTGGGAAPQLLQVRMKSPGVALPEFDQLPFGFNLGFLNSWPFLEC